MADFFVSLYIYIYTEVFWYQTKHSIQVFVDVFSNESLFKEKFWMKVSKSFFGICIFHTSLIIINKFGINISKRP